MHIYSQGWVVGWWVDNALPFRREREEMSSKYIGEKFLMRVDQNRDIAVPDALRCSSIVEWKEFHWDMWNDDGMEHPPCHRIIFPLIYSSLSRRCMSRICYGLRWHRFGILTVYCSLRRIKDDIREKRFLSIIDKYAWHVEGDKNVALSQYLNLTMHEHIITHS